METFTCDSCQHLLFFENNLCIRCGSRLGFSLVDGRIRALGPAIDGDDTVFPAIDEEEPPPRYRLCKNTILHNSCNWLISADSDQEYCESCQLTEVLPSLDQEHNRQRWVRVETAKRRLIYTLHQLRLPLKTRADFPETGLSFHFPEGKNDAPVMTGHADGVITLNIAEADHAFRENAREKLGEAYRTVLGHLRHEIGHYYWDLLVRDSEQDLKAVRELFGDDQLSYADSLKRHYEEGPPANWQDTFISAYATMHPWEDWAETFAHYLHMVDTLQTAHAYQMSLTSPSVKGGQRKTKMLVSEGMFGVGEFDKIFERWYALTFVLNGLSRSMGMPDSYPFSLPDAVRRKLKLVHEVICSAGARHERPTTRS